MLSSHTLAMLWLNGDLPFRPRWISQEFVLRVALRDPVRAAEITYELMCGRPSSVGSAFAGNLDSYRRNPRAWRMVTAQRCERQRAINEGWRRSGPGGIEIIDDGSNAGRGAAWGAP